MGGGAEDGGEGGGGGLGGFASVGSVESASAMSIEYVESTILRSVPSHYVVRPRSPVNSHPRDGKVE